MAIKIERVSKEAGDKTPDTVSTGWVSAAEYASAVVVSSDGTTHAIEYTSGNTATVAVAVTKSALSKLEARKAELLAHAAQIRVIDQATFELAAQARQALRSVKDVYDDLLKPGIARAHALHKSAVKELKDYTDPIDRTELAIKAQQDTYQIEQKRQADRERRAIEAAQQQARDQALAEQLEQAAQMEGPDEEVAAEVDALLERAAAPLPALPYVDLKVKAEGATSRSTLTHTLVDASRLNPGWLLEMVQEEILLKGGCEWLDKQIRIELKRSGEGTERVVGTGSIKVEEGVSTGVRRA